MFNKYANARQSINYSQPPLHSWCAGKIKFDFWMWSQDFWAPSSKEKLSQVGKNYAKRWTHTYMCMIYIYIRYNIRCSSSYMFEIGGLSFSIVKHPNVEKHVLGWALGVSPAKVPMYFSQTNEMSFWFTSPPLKDKQRPILAKLGFWEHYSI